MSDTPWLTVRTIARSLDVSESWVRNHAQTLGGIRIGRNWRFPPNTLDKLTAPCHQPPESPYTNAAKADTASAGAKTARNTKNAAMQRKQQQKIVPTKYAADFATEFPEFAKYASLVN